MAKQRFALQKTIVIGKEEEVGGILQEMQDAHEGLIAIQCYMNPSASALMNMIRDPQHRPQTILIANPRLGRSVEHVIDRARKEGCQIEYLPNLVEEVFHRIPLDLIDQFRDYYDVVFSKKTASWGERSFDLLFAAVGLLLSAPLSLGIGLGIIITSGRPIIFSQKRIGLFGQPFTFYKFRSLETHVTPDETQDPNSTISSRVTRIGRWIRKTRMDEIPQFWNVLRGTMSTIGPRPEMPFYHDQCIDQVPYYAYRLRVKPGITGWAQVCYKHTTTIEEYLRKTEYDLYYIKNRGFRLKMKILAKTLVTMLGMRGK